MCLCVHCKPTSPVRQARIWSGSSLHPKYWSFHPGPTRGVCSVIVFEQSMRLAEPQVLHLKDRNNSPSDCVSKLLGEKALVKDPWLSLAHLLFTFAQFSGCTSPGELMVHIFPQLCTQYHHVCSLKSATLRVFTPWKWAMEAGGFYFVFSFIDVKHLPPPGENRSSIDHLQAAAQWSEPAYWLWSQTSWVQAPALSLTV